MKRPAVSTSTLLAVTLAAALAGCGSESTNPGNAGGSGGSGASGGSGGRGGTGGSGGSATGGGGGSGGASGSGGNKDAGRTPDSGGAKDAGRTGDGSRADAGTAGAFAITVDNAGMMGDHLCFKKSATNSGGDMSPLITWTDPPTGTRSLVLSMEDQSNTPTPHQIVTDIPASIRMNRANVRGTLPMNASACYGHNNKTAWYGPGAGDVHKYEITIWALAVDKLSQACMGAGNGGTARAVLTYLKGKRNDPTVVLGASSLVLWGNREGACR
jgi:phosphatidylethanolamine-binding protein (PEBP) family uncharacterized protein